ncbi:hypothetical protein [Microbacterium sp. NPDC057944]
MMVLSAINACPAVRRAQPSLAPVAHPGAGIDTRIIGARNVDNVSKAGV